MLDRFKLCLYPLCKRRNKVRIERDAVAVDAPPRSPLSGSAETVLAETVERIRQARCNDRPVVLAFGAHTIKNGLGPVLIALIERGWVTHLATNGAGIIHDWEFAFQGESSEDVRANVNEGRFGLWAETGFNLNLALILGARDGLGYGEAIGRLITEEEHVIPAHSTLVADVQRAAESPDAADRAAAAADLLGVMQRFDLPSGSVPVPHPWSRYSIQAAAYRLGVPFTGHPMIGHDIIYVHPLNLCAAIGRTAGRDFLAYAAQIARLDGGVYLSVGSAVMSPMIFEKSMSMAQNLALRKGRTLENHFMVVVDLAESRWDWSLGEPPQDSPDYYLRYCKTFSRMGGTMRYATADNRDFLPALCRTLGTETPGA